MSRRIPLASIALALALLGGGAVATAQTATSRPAAEQARPERPPRRVAVDPARDPVIIAIREQVKPTAEEMTKIIALYTTLRQTEATVAADLRRAAADARDERAGGEGGGGLASRAGARADRTKLTEKVAAAAKPLREAFLREARATLAPERHAAWDACAKTLEFERRRTYARPELAWRDPARGPQVGDVAPDFTVKDLEGNAVTLSGLRPTPTVLLFGSLTIPKLHQNVDDIAILRKAYGDRVQWLLVYTLEAHASDEWKLRRNEKDGLSVPQHTTIEERAAAARRLHEMHPSLPPIHLDDMKNSVAKAYSGHPHRCYVIDGEGTVIERQIWFDVNETMKALRTIYYPDAGP